jgi:23S rRNA pseudouridine2605 synthase
VRLQRFLAQAGVASRRAAEQLIVDGRVAVNGQPVTILGTRIAASDRVSVDGREVRPLATEWIALHKPPGYVSTRHDPQGRRTLYDLLPQELGHLFYVGRLDADSEGLVLLTNDGTLANRLLHPRYQVERVYEADVAGDPSPDALTRLVGGVALEDGEARALRAERLARGRVRLTLTEGRKREVRRMLAAVGYPVRRLVRTRYGPVELGALPPGRWRRLLPHEIPRVSDAAADTDTD